MLSSNGYKRCGFSNHPFQSKVVRSSIIKCQVEDDDIMQYDDFWAKTLDIIEKEKQIMAPPLVPQEKLVMSKALVDDPQDAFFDEKEKEL